MSFAITKYIYPIEKPIELSKSLGFILDNPRTEKEIQIVKDYIEETLKEKDRPDDSTMASILFRYGVSLSDLKKRIRVKDEYAFKYFDNYKGSFDNLLSETWIIIRFQENDQFQEFAESKDALLQAMMRDRTDEVYVQDFNLMTNYCQVLSVLLSAQNYYYGDSILLSNDAFEIFITDAKPDVKDAINNLIGYNFYETKNWLFWPNSIETICKCAKDLETLIIQEPIAPTINKRLRLSQKQSPIQKVLHIGSILRAAFANTQDPSIMLLLLVSVFEYLITRNPNTNKFNVEDSISKQFRLKCAILIHQQSKEIDMEYLSEKLSKIYSQRSDLAHGNYRDNFDTKDVSNTVLQLYEFIRHILNAYIEDRKLVDYLKDH